MSIIPSVTATNSYTSSTSSSSTEALAGTATANTVASGISTYTSSTAAATEALAGTATANIAASGSTTYTGFIATSCMASTGSTVAPVTIDSKSSNLQHTSRKANVEDLAVFYRHYFKWDKLSITDKVAINARSNSVLEKTTHSDNFKALLDQLSLIFLHKDADGWFCATAPNQALLEPYVKHVNTYFEQYPSSPFVRLAHEQNVEPLQALLNPKNLLQIGDSEREQRFNPDRYLLIPPEATDAKEKSEMVGGVYHSIVYQRKVTESDLVCPYAKSCPVHQKGQCDGKFCVHKTVAEHFTDIGQMKGKQVTVMRPYLRCPFQNRLKKRKHAKPNKSFPQPVFKGLIPVDISDVCFLNTSMTNSVVADIFYTLMQNPEATISSIQHFYGFGSSQPINNIARLYWFAKHVYDDELWVNYPEADVLIPDEFYAMDCEYFTIFVNGKTHEVMGIVEGKTKARIHFMMEFFHAKGFDLKVLAADDNASFKAAAKLVWGDKFKFVSDPFHFLQAWSKEIAVPIVRYLLKTDRKALEALKEAGAVLSEDNQHLEGLSVEDTAHITMLLRNHAPLKELQEKLRNKGKASTADYIGNHPILSHMFSANYEIHALVHSKDNNEFSEHFNAAQHHLQQVVALSNGKLKTANTMIARLSNKRDSLINYLTTGYTSSIIEGFNCKIKLLKRCMRGAVNVCSFMLRVKSLFKPKLAVVHQAKWAA